MSIPKDPRQQMINMMYIVLTALLALNVSAEVLKSFEVINTGIAATNQTLDSKNTEILGNFRMKLANDSAKTQAYYADAMQVQQLTSDFYDYVEQIKKQVITVSGGYDDEGQIKKKKDTEAPTHVLVEQGNGLELQTRINELRNQLLLLPTLSANDKLTLEQTLPLQTTYDKALAQKLDKKDWTTFNFEKVPVIAALALLTKIQGDARTAETMLLERLYQKIDFNVFKFDKIMASSMNNNNYVIAGQEQFQARIFVAATSSTQQVEVFMGDFKDPAAMYDSAGQLVDIVDDFPLKDGFVTVPVSNGVAHFNEMPQSIGEKHKTGVIKLREADGEGYRFLPFEMDYKAAAPSAIVSPDKMNVMYIGLDNPISISVPGVPSEKVSATLRGDGSINGSNGAFIGRVKTPGTVEIDVFADIDGQRKKMGTQKFRVKRVPPPIPVGLGQSSGSQPRSFFCQLKQVDAVLPNFEFNAHFKVMSFTFLYENAGTIVQFNAHDNKFTQQMQNVLCQVQRGNHIYITDIYVEDPGGLRYKLQTELIYKVN